LYDKLFFKQIDVVQTQVLKILRQGVSALLEKMRDAWTNAKKVGLSASV
jgi:hypothetical protein